mgnify:FL=1
MRLPSTPSLNGAHAMLLASLPLVDQDTATPGTETPLLQIASAGQLPPPRDDSKPASNVPEKTNAKNRMP